MCKNTAAAAAAAASVGMSAAIGCVYSGGYSLFKRRGVFMSDVYSAQEPAGSLWFTLHHFGLQEKKTGSVVVVVEPSQRLGRLSTGLNLPLQSQDTT